MEAKVEIQIEACIVVCIEAETTSCARDENLFIIVAQWFIRDGSLFRWYSLTMSDLLHPMSRRLFSMSLSKLVL